MSTEFNYKKARESWAYPAWEKLPQQVKDLYATLARDYQDLNQGPGTGIEWPADLKLKRMFHAIDQLVLADAQAVVYYCGHWHTEGCGGPGGKDDAGAHWKFQILAKKAIIEEGLHRNLPGGKCPDVPAGLVEQFQEHVDGTPYDDHELAKMFDEASGGVFHGTRVIRANHRVVDKRCTVTKPHEPVERYATWIGGRKIHEDRSDNPHPFCIGQQHFPDRGSMYIDPRKAPCCICGYDFDEHVSDRLLVVRVAEKDEKACPTEAQKQAIVAAKGFMEQHKIDGVAFAREKT